MFQRYFIRNAIFLLRDTKYLFQIRNISSNNLLNLKNLRSPIYQIQQTHRMSKHGRPDESMFTAKKKTDTNTFSWVNFAVVATLGAGFIFMFKYLEHKKNKEKEIRKIVKLGKADIGGNYEMTDHTGKKVTMDSFLGNWVLLYFGFTHCPDICPTEIEKIIEATEIIKNVTKAMKLVPIFVSVDPARDDVETVAKYVKEYSTDMIGLTGTPEQVDDITRKYRVHYSLGPKDDEDDYIVDHSSSTYLINPKGQFVDYYGQTVSQQQLADSILFYMMKYKQ